MEQSPHDSAPGEAQVQLANGRQPCLHPFRPYRPFNLHRILITNDYLIHLLFPFILVTDAIIVIVVMAYQNGMADYPFFVIYLAKIAYFLASEIIISPICSTADGFKSKAKTEASIDLIMSSNFNN